jgi:hypothetical protein
VLLKNEIPMTTDGRALHVLIFAYSGFDHD